MRSTLVTITALALAVAGCKKPAPEAEQSEVSNSLTEVPADNLVAPPIVEAPPIVAPPAMNAAAAQPLRPIEPTVREEQQIEEDADASGMTARLPSDEDPQPADQGSESREQQ